MTKIAIDLKAAIIAFVDKHPLRSSKEIYEGLTISASYATLKRVLQSLIAENLLAISGKGKGTKYEISKAYALIHEVNVTEYFKKEIDERIILDRYNDRLIKEILNKVDLFSMEELEQLTRLRAQYNKKIAALPPADYKKELERLAIDLSWKSSQIEGNTYSLLETERLLKDKETAAGKTKDEAVMLLNHKEAIDFIVAHPYFVQPLKLGSIEDIHSILTKELGIARNIRIRSVGISGTNYKPLDNEFQIKEAMEEVCAVVNLKETVFEKALLALILISYIQPFNDGNKRTARIISNAILMNQSCCPLSYRTVDSIAYKEALLIFYEQNNLSAFKRIFIDQFAFAVRTYF